MRLSEPNKIWQRTLLGRGLLSKPTTLTGIQNDLQYTPVPQVKRETFSFLLSGYTTWYERALLIKYLWQDWEQDS